MFYNLYKMGSVPISISVVFVITTILTVGLAFLAGKKSKTTLFILLGWLVIQGSISLTGFYTDTDSVPPKFLLLVLPPLVLILLLLTTKKGISFVNNFDPGILTLLHIVRIPVEMVLFGLFLHETVPQLMTFEGRNFDILSGITAPIIYYFGYVRHRLSRKVLLGWNFICLILLFNIVINAILSAPFQFQQFAFNNPNIAILYFPFIWLPCCIVPLVLFAHIVSIRQLLKKQ